MGEMADFINDSSDIDACYDDRPRTKTCKYCGLDGLVWANYGTRSNPVWRLKGEYGIHKCSKKESVPVDPVEEVCDVKDIVKKYLVDNKFDGLYNDIIPDDGCGCLADDLFLCGEYCGNCIPGYKQKETHGYDFCIGPEKES